MNDGRERFWAFKPLLQDLGVGLLVYLMIIVIIMLSRVAPGDFMYVAF